MLGDLVGRLANVLQIFQISDSVMWIYVTNTLGIVRFLMVVGGALAWYRLAGPRRWQVKRALQGEPARP